MATLHPGGADRLQAEELMPTILVVDPIADNVRNLERELRQLGHEVVSARDTDQAVSVSQTVQPDVVLLGGSLQEASSVESCRLLKATPALRYTPLILVLSAGEESEVARGLEAGAFDYITRPFSTTILAARVRSAFQMSEAQARAQLRSDFLASTSDELRSPVAAIVDVANNLIEPDRSEEERRAAINRIRQSGDELLRIVNDIQDVSKIEAGELELQLVGCAPSEIVSGVVALMRPHAQAKGLELRVRYVGSMPRRIHTDPVRVRQILVNLVNNALRYTATGGVEVRVELPPIGLGCDTLQFEVVDSGVGVCDAAAAPDRVGASMERSAFRRLAGSGVGLTVSSRLTDLLGGEMTSSCKPGEGCTVRVSIPTGPLDGVPLEEPSEEEPSPTARSLPRFENSRILLAEDDSLTQKKLSTALVNSGAMVTVAVNGPSAVGLALAADAAESRFDVIVIGMQLSALGGETAVELLRRRGYAGRIIGLTTAPAERQRCLDVGCDEVVVKPVSSAALLVAVASQLEDAARSRPGVLRESEGAPG